MTIAFQALNLSQQMIDVLADAHIGESGVECWCSSSGTRDALIARGAVPDPTRPNVLILDFPLTIAAVEAARVRNLDPQTNPHIARHLSGSTTLGGFIGYINSTLWNRAREGELTFERLTQNGRTVYEFTTVGVQ